jgi:hypothetical protein
MVDPRWRLHEYCLFGQFPIVPEDNWNSVWRQVDEQQEQFQTIVRLTAELIGYGLIKSRRPREAAPAGRSRTGPALLSKRKLVFVIDDDPGMLRGVQRLLREHGYDSMSFSSADAFQKHDNFEQAVCVVLDINLNVDSGRGPPSLEGGRNILAGHLYHMARTTRPREWLRSSRAVLPISLSHSLPNL